VLVVWMPVLAGDSREAWNRSVISDPRVTQLWDQNQVLGTWLQQHGGAFWDTFLVYGPKARWTSHPTVPSASGSPIIGATDSLSHALAATLGTA
jgi:hypothetical protein